MISEETSGKIWKEMKRHGFVNIQYLHERSEKKHKKI
jgi:hypothetical protein